MDPRWHVLFLTVITAEGRDQQHDHRVEQEVGQATPQHYNALFFCEPIGQVPHGGRDDHEGKPHGASAIPRPDGHRQQVEDHGRERRHHEPGRPAGDPDQRQREQGHGDTRSPIEQFQERAHVRFLRLAT